MRQPRETGDLSQICTRTLIWRSRVEQEPLGGGQQTCQVASPSNRRRQHQHRPSMWAPQLPTCLYPSMPVSPYYGRGSCENYIRPVPSGWRSHCSLGHPAICFPDSIAGRATVPPSGKTKPVYCFQPYNHTYHAHTHLVLVFHVKYHHLEINI